MAFYDGTPSPVILPGATLKVAGAGGKPRPGEGKLWPTGLPKQAS